MFDVDINKPDVLEICDPQNKMKDELTTQNLEIAPESAGCHGNGGVKTLTTWRVWHANFERYFFFLPRSPMAEPRCVNIDSVTTSAG